MFDFNLFSFFLGIFTLAVICVIIQVGRFLLRDLASNKELDEIWGKGKTSK